MTAHLQRIHAASQGTLAAMANDITFAALIARCAVLVGQPVPQPQAILLMHGLITDHFIWATIEDIELAVKFNITRSLPSFTETYGEFSGIYLSSVLKAYEPERGKAIQKYRAMEERKELPPRQITPDEWQAMIEDHRQWKKTGSDRWTIMAARMASYLWESGIVNDDMFSIEEWKAIRGQARRCVMERMGIGPTAVQNMNTTQRERFDGDALMEVRTIIYGRYLDGL